jgi:hypothetical protein
MARRRQKKSHWWKVVTAAASSSLLTLNAAGVFLLQADPFHPPEYVPPPTPEEYLAKECREPDCDLTLLNTIISCESGWRMVKNSSSSAFGYFQIIDGTERTTPQYQAGERKFDPYTNLDMGLFLYQSRGTNPWNESKHCWLPRYRQAMANKPERITSFPAR